MFELGHMLWSVPVSPGYLLVRILVSIAHFSWLCTEFLIWKVFLSYYLLDSWKTQLACFVLSRIWYLQGTVNFVMFSLESILFERVVICSIPSLTRKITFLMAADRRVGEVEIDDQFSSKDKATNSEFK